MGIPTLQRTVHSRRWVSVKHGNLWPLLRVLIEPCSQSRMYPMVVKINALSKVSIRLDTTLPLLSPSVPAPDGVCGDQTFDCRSSLILHIPEFNDARTKSIYFTGLYAYIHTLADSPFRSVAPMKSMSGRPSETGEDGATWYNQAAGYVAVPLWLFTISRHRLSPGSLSAHHSRVS